MGGGEQRRLGNDVSRPDDRRASEDPVDVRESEDEWPQLSPLELAVCISTAPGRRDGADDTLRAR